LTEWCALQHDDGFGSNVVNPYLSQATSLVLIGFGLGVHMFSELVLVFEVNHDFE
jgi:hypothetical protein